MKKINAKGGYMTPEIIDIYYTGIIAKIRKIFGLSNKKHSFNLYGAVKRSLQLGRPLTKKEKEEFIIQ